MNELEKASQICQLINKLDWYMVRADYIQKAGKFFKHGAVLVLILSPMNVLLNQDILVSKVLLLISFLCFSGVVIAGEFQRQVLKVMQGIVSEIEKIKNG